MRIFLDVGGHYGESLDIALDPRWGFDTLYSFEPSRTCQRLLRSFRDSRLTVVPAGLSNKQATTTLYGSGLLGASVYADKTQSDARPQQETIELLKATDWLLANTSADDEIFAKLNCEGSECDVLEDLLDSGVISRLASVYVDFDVRKIPSQQHRQELVEKQLRDQNVHFATPDTLGAPGGSAAMRKWLTMETTPRRTSTRAVWRYRLGLHRPPYVWSTAVARKVLPGPVYAQAARRLGTQARRRQKAHSG